MRSATLKKEIALGEDSRRQFKRTLRGAAQAAADMVAFLNCGGGRLFLGVNDDGVIEGLDLAEVRRLNQLLANASTENVRPAAPLRTFTRAVEGKTILLVEIPDGLNKPYCDNEGRFWVRHGADKRKITAPEELQRLFQAGKKLHADERPVVNCGIDDLDRAAIERFHETKFGIPLAAADVPLEKMCEALGLSGAGTPTLAGLLLFGRNVARYCPLFKIQAVAFEGFSVDDDRFLDRQECEGTLSEQYRQAMAFLKRNLPHQPDPREGFNQPGNPEISLQAVSELVVNALVHRDYLVNASVKLFLFPDRLEIHSPGVLPNSLTVENIRVGVSVPRNTILLSHAQFVMPYSGLGSGILRALRHCPNICFDDDRQLNRFLVRIPRAHPAAPAVREPPRRFAAKRPKT